MSEDILGGPSDILGDVGAIPLDQMGVASGVATLDANGRLKDVQSRIAPWAANRAYLEGDLVTNSGIIYRALSAFTSASTFNFLNWAQVPVGGSPRYTNPYTAGLCVNSRLRSLSAPNMILAAAQIKGYGFTWHRDVLSWSASEPISKGSYVWTTADAEMTASAQAGLRWLPCISATPPWALIGGVTSNFARPPTNSQDYADFVLAVWQRFGVGGAFWTANPTLDSTYALSWVQLWNEPFNQAFFQGEGTAAAPYNVAGLPDPEKYADMCKKVGTSLRVSAPTAKVLISGEPFGNIPGFTSDNAAGRWFQRVLTAEPTLLTYSTGGATGLFDGYNVHPYVGPFYYSPWDIPQGAGALQMLDPQGRFDKIAKAQRQFGEAMLKNSVVGTKEMWLTEFGWPITGTSGVGEDAQADYLHGAIRRVFREFNNDIYGNSVLGQVFPYVLDTYAASSNDLFSITKFSSAAAPATPAKALNRLQTMIRAGDSLESYGDAVLKKRPILFCPLDERTINVVRDRSETQVQGIVPAVLTRGAASLTTEPEGASTTFDGASSTITVPDHSVFDIDSVVTLEAWVKFGHMPSAAEDLIRKMSSYTLQINQGGITGTGNTVGGTNTILSITGTNWRPGLVITGANIPAGTTIKDYSGTTLTLSANATGGAVTGTTFTAQTAIVSMGTYTATVATLTSLSAIDTIDINATAGYHIVGVYDGVNHYVFVNGKLLKSAAKTGLIDLTANPVGVGWRGVSATGYFNGQLQNAAIYPRALAPREIAENYQAGKAVFA